MYEISEAFTSGRILPRNIINVDQTSVKFAYPEKKVIARAGAKEVHINVQSGEKE